MIGSDTSAPSVLELLGPSTGGIRRHVAALGSILADQGWAVTYAGPAGVLDNLGETAEVVGVPSSFSPAPIARAVRQLRSLRGVDVIHAHGLKAGWVAVLSRRRGTNGRRIPIVLTIHNVVLDEVSGRSAGVLRHLERLLMGRVDRVIAASPGIAEQSRTRPSMTPSQSSSRLLQVSGAGPTSSEQEPHTPTAQLWIPSMQVPTMRVPAGPV